jgi:diguanylate cyclase (GGDEF)-like protein/PAS domain S-box-containing protein
VSATSSVEAFSSLRTLRRLAVAIATIVAVAVPSMYLVAAYQEVVHHAHTEASVKADRLSAIVAEAPDVWTYADGALERIAQEALVHRDAQRVEIRDANAALVAASGALPRWAAAAHASFYDAGAPAGSVSVHVSLRSMLIAGAGVSAIGALLGIVVYVSLMRMPVASVERAVRLEQEKARLEAASRAQAERAERSLRESEERYRRLVELSPDAIYIETEGKVRFINSAGIKLFGAATASDLIHRPTTDLIDPAYHRAVTERSRQLSETNLPTHLIEGRIIRLDGTALEVEASAGPFVYAGQPGIQVVMRDITGRKKAAERITYLAQYDALTGLPNRGLFRYRLAAALVRANQNKQLLGLMFLDLDRFKEVNDSLGHAAGDELLQAAARRLQDAVRDGDTIARLGGDEFTVILEEVTDIDQIETIAQRIQTSLSTPFLVQEREIFVTASIGIAVYPYTRDGVEALVQAADVAMYCAKKSGRNTFEFYAPEMNAQAIERLDMERCLRRALERNELLLHYQPKVATQSGRIIGAEALLRWQSEELGLISPGTFIPLAEETGLIVPIGVWVLKTACAQAKAWYDQGLPLSVSVNLSPRQFQQKTLAQSIRAALHETGLPAHLLELEITESMVMEHAEEATAVLSELSALGVQLSVDDFGTGHSSLANLKRFPVHRLKIDQSFVRGLTTDASDAAIVRTIIAMARNLGLGVVAEGVETCDQLTALVDLGCDELQGFCLSKPVSADDFAHLLQCMPAAEPKGRPGLPGLPGLRVAA